MTTLVTSTALTTTPFLFLFLLVRNSTAAYNYRPPNSLPPSQTATKNKKPPLLIQTQKSAAARISHPVLWLPGPPHPLIPPPQRYAASGSRKASCFRPAASPKPLVLSLCSSGVGLGHLPLSQAFSVSPQENPKSRIPHVLPLIEHPITLPRH